MPSLKEVGAFNPERDRDGWVIHELKEVSSRFGFKETEAMQKLRSEMVLNPDSFHDNLMQWSIEGSILCDTQIGTENEHSVSLGMMLSQAALYLEIGKRDWFLGEIEGIRDLAHGLGEYELSDRLAQFE